MTLIKIALLGDGAVGKTALLDRYITRSFSSSSYIPTIGAECSIHDTLIEGKKIRFQIWDLAGQPGFSGVRPIYYRGSVGIIMVYDITRMETFQNIPTWLEESYKHTGKGAVPVVLLANKTDLRDEVPNALTKDQGLELVKGINKITISHGFRCSFFETSAKTGQNVDVAFMELGRKIMDFIEAAAGKSA